MKKIVFIFLIGLILIAGCTGLKTASRGLENEAFLEFVGIPTNYPNGIDVQIDDKITFKAYVVKDYAVRPKGKVYAIATGAHLISISHKNTLIFKKQIFVSAQETKKITLP